MRKSALIILILGISLVFFSCSIKDAGISENNSSGISNKSEEKTEISTAITTTTTPPNDDYINPDGITVSERINPPKGYKRTDTSDYGLYLRNLELLPNKSDVLLFDGRKKGNQNAHIAVLALDVDNRDLQQCADAALRLRCEYLYQVEADEMINYHLTSGDEFPYEKYRDGYRLVVSGNDVKLEKIATYDRSYETFRKYLLQLFGYAGTLSVSKESTPVEDEEMEVGDIFVMGGSPGHCVIVIDMCENETGDKLFLLAQSYMPAQQIQILKNPANSDDNPWYSLSSLSYPFKTPEWIFDEGSLKRMP